MPTRVRSHAKINLGLSIGAPRADGFHALTTVYQTLELHDVVTVAARPAAAAAIRLTSNDRRVPLDARNTAWKMVSLVLQELGVAAEVDIDIDKRLPVQGGLGAGSANAAAALVGLEAELGIAGVRAFPPFGQSAPEGWGTQRELPSQRVSESASQPSQPGAPGLDFQTWESTDLSDWSWPARRPGAPGLDFQTWESTDLSDWSWPARRPGAPGPDFRTWESTNPPSHNGIDAAGAPGPDFRTWESTNPPSHNGIDAAGWPARRLRIAAQVGSDVPLFLIGGTVLGLDRGQEVYPLPDLDPAWCVVAQPETGVSTPQAFRDWDALCAAEGLTAEASEDKLKQLSRAYASAFAGAIPRDRQKTSSSGVISNRDDLAGPEESALVRTGITRWIQNDFEQVVFRQQPSLREIKRILAGQNHGQTAPEAALYASLSGSGSALFGLYQARGDAEAACARLEAAGVRSQLTRTLPRADYWRQMIL